MKHQCLRSEGKVDAGETDGRVSENLIEGVQPLAVYLAEWEIVSASGRDDPAVLLTFSRSTRSR